MPLGVDVPKTLMEHQQMFQKILCKCSKKKKKYYGHLGGVKPESVDAVTKKAFLSQCEKRLGKQKGNNNTKHS